MLDGLFSNPIYYPSVATISACFVAQWLAGKTAAARAKYKVFWPHTTGNVDFERHFRAHQNQVEQMVVTIPLIWICAMVASPSWSMILGCTWSLLRIGYGKAYHRSGKYTKILPWTIPAYLCQLAMAGSSIYVIVSDAYRSSLRM